MASVIEADERSAELRAKIKAAAMAKDNELADALIAELQEHLAQRIQEHREKVAVVSSQIADVRGKIGESQREVKLHRRDGLSKSKLYKDAIAAYRAAWALVLEARQLKLDARGVKGE